MASPFRVFRKHQKLMLALLGVLVMIGFVILPAIMKTMGQSKPENIRVATTTRYGDLSRSNLAGIRWHRQKAIRFLQSLARELIMADENYMPVQFALQNIVGDENVSPTSDEALAETWLLARRAEELGLVVDDQTINTFLAELMQASITSEGIAAILEGMGISEDDLFSSLRQELLAMRLRRMFSLSLRGMTPAQRWDCFQRLNRKVTIEWLAVPVSEFVDDAPDPSDATLRAFLDQYKAEPDDPSSPDPGFREPKKVAVEYLKAEYEAFFNRELEAVTEEEVEKYYQDNKEDYKQEELPGSADEGPAAAESEREAEGDEAAEQEAPAQQGPAIDQEPSSDQEASGDQEVPTEQEMSTEQEASSDQESPTDQEMSTEQETPADDTETETPEQEPAADAPVDEPAQNEEEPVDAGPADQPSSGSTDSGDGTSSLDAASPFRLVSLAEQGGPADETSGEEAVEPPGPAAVPEQSPKQPDQPQAEPQQGDATTEAGPSAKPEDSQAEEKKEPDQPKYLPREKVEDEIRRTLARERVGAKIDAIFRRVEELIRQHRDDLALYRAGQREAPPQEPDFTAAYRAYLAALVDEKEKEWEISRDLVADPKGVRLLTRITTDLISALDARKRDIGKSFTSDRTGFVEIAYNDDWQNLQPAGSFDREGNRYLFWKVNDAEERIPEFDEPGVRERVLRRWKIIEALGLARKEADRTAAEAREAKKSLSDVFADRSGAVVTESEPFSWLTYGAIPDWMAQGPPWLSEVKGVDAPGNDFMRAVFSLKKGEVGTAINHPQTVVYVVQVTDSNPLPEVLWREFRSKDYRRYYLAASHDHYLAHKAWVDGIKSAAGFEWDAEWVRLSSGVGGR